MRIEEELNTKKFKNEAHKAHLNIFFTASWLRAKISPFFKKHGLTLEQYNVLRIVRGAGEPLMVKDISARTVDRNSNTTRIIDRLVKKELVIRTQAKLDRRVFRVSLTDNGLNLMSKMDDKMIEHDPHFSKMNMEKCQQLNELLDEMRNVDSV